MALHDEAVDIPLVAVDGDAYLASLGSEVIYDSDVTVTLTRTVRTPLSISAAGGGNLLIVFNVFQSLSVILPIIFNVQNGGLNANLPITFTVINEPSDLMIQFRVIPNLIPLFSDTIQRPKATVVEIP
jgi:hypothetical protein